MAQAMGMEDPCEFKGELAADNASALAWVAARSDQEACLNSPFLSCHSLLHFCVQVIEQREKIITKIEADAAAFRASGACDAWLKHADAGVRKISAGVNGPILESIVDEAAHCAVCCPELFRNGA